MKIFKIITIIISVIFISNQVLAIKKNDINNHFMVDKISKNLRCLICQGQSVYDSQSDFAISIKILIQKKIKDGKTEIEIYEFLKKDMDNGSSMIQNLTKKHFSYGYFH